MRVKILSFLLYGMCIASVWGQETITYGGRGIKPFQVISSDQAMLKETPDTVRDDAVMDGTGMDYNWSNMGRLIRQASLGVDFEDMAKFAKITPEQWIDEQMKIPPPNMLELTRKTHTELRAYAVSLGVSFGADTVVIRSESFHNAWWAHVLKGKDYLRQRVAYALSQIYVISDQSDVSEFALGMATFQDLLLKHAFGSFQDLLLGITLHPSMGLYLSHFNNSKSVPERNIHPDENYAREIMQLFSIGLYQLNLDGTLKRDSSGNLIPTYSQQDIKELAKIFTGLSAGKAGGYSQPTELPRFGWGIYNTDFTVPMGMFEEWHETGPKSFLGLNVPAGQKGLKDIEMAINHLANHPNVGPFIGKQLIQKLVTSNPSPAYVKSVAEAFNNNGKGVRGDMAAVIRAILLHPEARSCASLQIPTQGKLQEPFVRYLERVRNYRVIPDANNKIFTNGGSAHWNTGQNYMSAPSVFNFYQPGYSPLGMLQSNQLVGPEFQLHNSTTAIRWVNQSSNTDWILNFTWTLAAAGSLEMEIPTLNPYTNDPEALINQIDKRFTRGQMTDRTRSLIKKTILQYLRGSERIRHAIHITLSTPEFNILK